MANTTLNTRIQLKYDTYVNWTTNNPVLLAGEVAVTTVQSAQAPVSQVPAILFKVGDGTNNFNTLNWASAIAADVYPWAKASVKPTYQASEIEGLEDYISGQIEDTDTQYQIIASGTNGIQLQSRPKTGGAWTNVGSPITITYTLETGTTNGTVSFNGTEVAVKGLGSAAYTESSAYDAAGTAAGVQTAVIGTSGDQSSAITIYGTRKYAAEQATAAQTAATTAANSYTDGQITQAKTDLIGTGDATSNTIKGAVAESKTYADTQIAAKGVPSTEGVPTDYLLSPAGWVAPPDTNDNLWGYHERVELEVQTGPVIFTPDKPLKKILLLIYAKQEYADEAGQDEPSGDTAQHIRINNSPSSVFYVVFNAGSFAKFKKSRVLLEIIESNLVGTYEKLVGVNSGPSVCCGADGRTADEFPIYDNINSVSIHPSYRFAPSYGDIGRFTAGSTFEIWGVYL